MMKASSTVGFPKVAAGAGFTKEEKEVATEKEKVGTTRGQDATRIPNWVFPILATIVLGLIAVIWQFNQAQFNEVNNTMREMKSHMETVDTFIKNTREQLIAHGWSIDDNGNIHPPDRSR